MTHIPPAEQIEPESAAVAPPLRQRPSRRLLLLGGAGLVVVVVVVVVLLAFVGGGSTKDLGVDLSLLDFGGTSTCQGGTGGYEDIGPGTDVVVRDDANGVIATGALGDDGPGTALPDSAGGSGCIWQTTIHGVPTGKKFYSIEVGRRGAQVFSAGQLDKDGWHVALQLGGG